MSFEETYQAEVLMSRRARSQRALFWAKIVGFCLMITIGATLRSEPQLRQAIMNLGMDAVTKVADTKISRPAGSSIGPFESAPDMSQIGALLSQAQNMHQTSPQAQQPEAAKPSAGFRDAVRVNRHGQSQSGPSPFQSVSNSGTLQSVPGGASPDAGAMAVDLGKLLENFMPGQ